MTIAELLAWGVGAIKPIAPETAAREATILLAHVLGGPAYQVTLMRDRPAEADIVARFRELISRRLQRCPVQYLTGECEFYSLKFKVRPGVLIPRPETELVVQTALEALTASGRDPGYIADVGTGSGCIAIALAANLLQTHKEGSFHVFAVDTSETALGIARENAGFHRVSNVVTFKHQDAFALRARPTIEGLRGANPKVYWNFRLVVSNPPYVSQAEYAALQPEVRDWEPREALVAGPDGLDVIRHVIESAPYLLESGGHLVMEIGAGHSDALRRLNWSSFGYQDVTFLRDLAGIERVLRARLA